MGVEVSPLDVVLRLLILLLANQAIAESLAPHVTVLAAGVFGAYVGMRIFHDDTKSKKKVRTRIQSTVYIGGCALVSWMATSAVLNLVHALAPSVKFDDRLWLAPVAWLIAFIGPHWRVVIRAALSGAESVVKRLSGASK